jgi:hypothetical protein
VCGIFGGGLFWPRRSDTEVTVERRTLLTLEVWLKMLRSESRDGQKPAVDFVRAGVRSRGVFSTFRDSGVSSIDVLSQAGG